MIEFVYILCAATSTACAVLLLSSYRRNKTKLLFWSGLCFIGLAVNNMVLFVDLMVVSSVDLSLVRSGAALGAMMILLYGLVRESR